MKRIFILIFIIVLILLLFEVYAVNEKRFRSAFNEMFVSSSPKSSSVLEDDEDNDKSSLLNNFGFVLRKGVNRKRSADLETCVGNIIKGKDGQSYFGSFFELPSCQDKDYRIYRTKHLLQQKKNGHLRGHQKWHSVSDGNEKGTDDAHNNGQHITQKNNKLQTSDCENKKKKFDKDKEDYSEVDEETEDDYDNDDLEGDDEEEEEEAEDDHEHEQTSVNNDISNNKDEDDSEYDEEEDDSKSKNKKKKTLILKSKKLSTLAAVTTTTAAATTTTTAVFTSKTAMKFTPSKRHKASHRKIKKGKHPVTKKKLESNETSIVRSNDRKKLKKKAKQKRNVILSAISPTDDPAVQNNMTINSNAGVAQDIISTIIKSAGPSLRKTLGICQKHPPQNFIDVDADKGTQKLIDEILRSVENSLVSAVSCKDCIPLHPELLAFLNWLLSGSTSASCCIPVNKIQHDPNYFLFDPHCHLFGGEGQTKNCKTLNDNTLSNDDLINGGPTCTELTEASATNKYSKQPLEMSYRRATKKHIIQKSNGD